MPSLGGRNHRPYEVGLIFTATSDGEKSQKWAVSVVGRYPLPHAEFGRRRWRLYSLVHRSRGRVRPLSEDNSDTVRYYDVVTPQPSASDATSDRESQASAEPDSAAGADAESASETNGQSTRNDDHLGDIADGSGCTEIWEHLSERREQSTGDE